MFYVLEVKIVDMEREPSFSEVLQNFEFLKFLGGQSFSNLGDAVLRVSLMLYVYTLTGSLTTTTLILSAQIIPWIVVGPIAGVFADRISRKAIMVTSDIVRAISIAIIPFTTHIPTLVGISFMIGVASASFTAPRSAAIPEIVGMRLFVKAISISQLIFQTVSIIGPLAGAYVYAAFGPITFYISTGSFLLSAFMIQMTQIPDADRNNASLSISLVISDLKEGMSFLLTNKVTKNILILFTFFIMSMAFASPLIYPYIFEEIYHGNLQLEELAQREYGLVGSVIAAGSIVGNLLFGKYEYRIGRPRAIAIGGMMLGLYFMVYWSEPSVQIILILAGVYGFFSGMMSLAVNSIFAEAIPNEIRGRAYAATNAYLQIFTAAFTALSGITADTFGIVSTIGGVGLLMFSAVLLFSLITGYRFLDNEKIIIEVEDREVSELASIV